MPPNSPEAVQPEPVALDRDDNDYAAQYDEAFVARWDDLIDWQKRALGEGDFFAGALMRAGACRILDASAGSGFHSVQLSRKGFDVVACDGSAAMVERARRNFREHGVKVPLHHCDWRALASEKLGRFDAVLCLGSSLCHVFQREERIDVLRRFRYLLRPGGMLLLDRRNFDAILAGRYKASGRYYYCGDQATVSLGEVNDSLCEFRYGFEDGQQWRLRVYPLRHRDVCEELAEAGFVEHTAFGDFKPLFDLYGSDFVLHKAIAP